MNNGKDRYPGLRSFEKEDHELFFGRDKEIKKLGNLINNERCTILFGASGVGKSSLINTVFQKSKELENFWPIRIRIRSVNNTQEEQELIPTQIVETRFRKYFLKKFNEIYDKGEIIFDRNEPGLWEFIKLAEVKLAKLQPAKIIVLILDQFEEYFNYSPAIQDDFNMQLAEIAHELPPKRILDWITNLKDVDRTDEKMDWYLQPNIKILFSIRSDKLSCLNGMVSTIPQILKNRFELAAFSKNNAIDAITKPACLSNDNLLYNSPPIDIHKTVIDKIINDLSNSYNEIEGSFLQIVCYYIEEKVKFLTRDQISTFNFNDELFDEEINISTILDKFYIEQTAKWENQVEVNFIRKVIEDDLVYDGQRTSLLRNQLLSKLKNNNRLIEFLLSARLIREENSPNGIRYELSHDKLVIPVEKSKSIRIEKEKIERENSEKEQRLLSEKKEREVELERQKQMLKVELRLKNEAIEAKSIAEQQRQIAQEEKLKAEQLKRFAEEEKNRAEEQTIIAEREKEKAEYEKGKAENLKREADKLRIKARSRSKWILFVGVLLTLLGIGSVYNSLKQARQVKGIRAEYLVYKAKDATNNLNNYLAFNLLWVADSLTKSNRSGFFHFLWAKDSLAESNIAELELDKIPPVVLTGLDIQQSEDGKKVISLTGDSLLYIWTVKDSMLLLDTMFEHVRDYVVSGTFNRIAFNKNLKIIVWDILKNRKVDILNDYDSINITDLSRLKGTKENVTFSYNGDKIAYFDSSYNLKVRAITDVGSQYIFFKNIATLDKIQRRADSISFKSSKNPFFPFRSIYTISFSKNGAKLIYLTYHPKKRSTSNSYETTRYDYSLHYFNLDSNNMELNNIRSILPQSPGVLDDANDVFWYETKDSIFILKRNDGQIKGFKQSNRINYRINYPYIIVGKLVRPFHKSDDTQPIEIAIKDIDSGDLVFNITTYTEPYLFVSKYGLLYVDTLNNLNYLKNDKKQNTVISKLFYGRIFGIYDNGKKVAYKSKDTLYIRDIDLNKIINKVYIKDLFNLYHSQNGFILAEDRSHTMILIFINKLNKDQFRKLLPYLTKREQVNNHIINQ